MKKWYDIIEYPPKGGEIRYAPFYGSAEAARRFAAGCASQASPHWEARPC